MEFLFYVAFDFKNQNICYSLIFLYIIYSDFPCIYHSSSLLCSWPKQAALFAEGPSAKAEVEGQLQRGVLDTLAKLPFATWILGVHRARGKDLA